MRKFLAVLTLLALVVCPAFAQNLVTNGDFGTGTDAGWTQWTASWSTTNTWTIMTASGNPAPCARARLEGGAGSFGWFQKIIVEPSKTYTLDASWFGNIGAGSWAEIMFFRTVPTITDAEIVTRLDAGAAADIAFKKDSWGQNLPTSANGAWAWESADLSPASGGNNGIVATNLTRYQLVVGLKFGHSQDFGPLSGNVRWDNIVVTGPPPVPEPSSLAAMLIGLSGMAGYAVRRRK